MTTHSSILAWRIPWTEAPGWAGATVHGIAKSRTELMIHCVYKCICCVCLVDQLCPTLFYKMDHSPPGSSVYGDSPVKNTGMGCHFLLEGIFLTQGLNPGFLHYRQTLYYLSHQGSQRQ